MSASIVQFHGLGSPHHCGYCDGNGSVSDGMSAMRLKPADYQMMIDRGWRRSGTYCYKPDIQAACCKLYTIRCDATQIRLRRSQKRIVKQFNTYLFTGEHPKLNKRVNVNKNDSASNAQDNADTQSKTREVKLQQAASGSKKTNNEKAKAKVRRWQRRLQHLQSVAERTGQPYEATLNAYRERREARLSRRQTKSLENRMLIPEATRNQSATPSHSASSDASSQSSKRTATKSPGDNAQAYEAKHKLEVRLVRSNDEEDESFERTFKTVFNLYKTYQQEVHNDKVASTRHFRNFLCESPLLYERCNCTANCTLEYGSFHQHYLLDGKLIMVGVIDILPNCVSSVYLFYDPAYAFLSLGTYSALQELQFTRKLHGHTSPLVARALDETVSSVRFYYMGFYIDTCVKMRYKGQHRPSSLLCPETYTWHPIEVCLPIIRQQGYARLADADALDSELFTTVNAHIPRPIAAAPLVASILVYTPSGPCEYRALRQPPAVAQRERDRLLRYVVMVGKTLSQRMVLVLS